MDRFDAMRMFVRVVQSGSFSTVAREAGAGPVNTDDNGWLEHRAPYDLLGG